MSYVNQNNIYTVWIGPEIRNESQWSVRLEDGVLNVFDVHNIRET